MAQGNDVRMTKLSFWAGITFIIIISPAARDKTRHRSVMEFHQ